MKHWVVVSPMMEAIDVILDDGTGPTEHFCCVCEIEAETAEDAILFSLKHPDMQEWVKQQRDDGCPPMAGLKAEESLCHHGWCYCIKCEEEKGLCPDCEREAEEEWKKNK